MKLALALAPQLEMVPQLGMAPHRHGAGLIATATAEAMNTGIKSGMDP